MINIIKKQALCEVCGRDTEVSLLWFSGPNAKKAEEEYLQNRNAKNLGDQTTLNGEIMLLQCSRATPLFLERFVGYKRHKTVSHGQRLCIMSGRAPRDKGILSALIAMIIHDEENPAVNERGENVIATKEKVEDPNEWKKGQPKKRNRDLFADAAKIGMRLLEKFARQAKQAH